MEISQIKTLFKPIEQITPKLQPNKTEPGESASRPSFGQMFSSAIQEVDQLQKVADSKIESVTLGKGDVKPHEAMLALEKADMAFQLMNTIRSKIINAYQEVIRTQV